MESSEYLEGREAYLQGKSLTDNPYAGDPYASGSESDWRRGYLAAEQEGLEP
jgi:hypothetical protein